MMILISSYLIHSVTVSHHHHHRRHPHRGSDRDQRLGMAYTPPQKSLPLVKFTRMKKRYQSADIVLIISTMPFIGKYS